MSIVSNLFNSKEKSASDSNSQDTKNILWGKKIGIDCGLPAEAFVDNIYQFIFLDNLLKARLNENIRLRDEAFKNNQAYSFEKFKQMEQNVEAQIIQINAEKEYFFATYEDTLATFYKENPEKHIDENPDIDRFLAGAILTAKKKQIECENNLKLKSLQESNSPIQESKQNSNPIQEPNKDEFNLEELKSGVTYSDMLQEESLGNKIFIYEDVIKEINFLIQSRSQGTQSLKDPNSGNGSDEEFEDANFSCTFF